MSGKTMKAVVFKEPKKVVIEDRPVPTLQNPTDVIAKVNYTALCGSELHVFRGLQPSDVDFIMGHEFTCTVEEVGKDVKEFKKGDKIVSPFTLSCGNCFFCDNGYSSRCKQGALYGTPVLDGGQAEYVRVPLVDTTAFHAPPEIPDELLVLMADIFPTGYYGAKNAFQFFTKEQCKEATIVMLGCGPVGLCALTNIQDYNPKHVFAVDSNQERLKLAKELGAEPLDLNDKDALQNRIKEATDGRGADCVLEVVGHEDALKLAFDILRPWGVISSIGVHNEKIPWTGRQAYDKNLRIQMGRCPVRTVFAEALDALKRKHHQLKFMADKIMPLKDAIEGYEIFDKGKATKVVFEADKI